MTSNSLDGPSLHDFVSSQPPVIDNPPVIKNFIGKIIRIIIIIYNKLIGICVRLNQLHSGKVVDHYFDRKRSHESGIISSVPHEIAYAHEDADMHIINPNLSLLIRTTE